MSEDAHQSNTGMSPQQVEQKYAQRISYLDRKIFNPTCRSLFERVFELRQIHAEATRINSLCPPGQESPRAWALGQISATALINFCLEQSGELLDKGELCFASEVLLQALPLSDQYGIAHADCRRRLDDVSRAMERADIEQGIYYGTVGVQGATFYKNLRMAMRQQGAFGPLESLVSLRCLVVDGSNDPEGRPLV